MTSTDEHKICNILCIECIKMSTLRIFHDLSLISIDHKPHLHLYSTTGMHKIYMTLCVCNKHVNTG